MRNAALALSLALTGLLVLAGAGRAPGPPAGRRAAPAGVLGIPTQLMDERDRARAALREAEAEYHYARMDFLLQVEQRRLAAKQRELEETGYWCMAASVIDVSMTDEEQRLWVSAGRRHGVAEGTIAMDFRGLVGRVGRIAEDACEVVLLTDPLCGVPVEVVDAPEPADAADEDAATPDQPAPRTVGAVRGGQPDDSLLLSYLEGPPAVPGARVVTSGVGAIYPPGIGVGQVIGHPTIGEGAGPASAQVRAYVDWFSLREVLLAYGG